MTADFTTHYVEEGDIVIILPGHIHGISQHEGYSMEYENILFSVDMFRSRNHDSLDSEFFLPLLAGDVDIKSIYDRDDPLYPSLSACLNRVDKLCSETPKGYHLALKGCYLNSSTFSMPTPPQGMRQTGRTEPGIWREQNSSSPT